jgi:hypothetical protein
LVKPAHNKSRGAGIRNDDAQIGSQKYWALFTPRAFPGQAKTKAGTLKRMFRPLPQIAHLLRGIMEKRSEAIPPSQHHAADGKK